MEVVKRFFREEAGTAEATSTVIMIGAVGVLLAAGLIAWYTGLQNAYTHAGNQATAMNDSWNASFSGS
jgi:Flp pilus assembly pilin Flp